MRTQAESDQQSFRAQPGKAARFERGGISFVGQMRA